MYAVFDWIRNKYSDRRGQAALADVADQSHSFTGRRTAEATEPPASRRHQTVVSNSKRVETNLEHFGAFVFVSPYDEVMRLVEAVVE